jgi:hypothetical protein
LRIEAQVPGSARNLPLEKLHARLCRQRGETHSGEYRLPARAVHLTKADAEAHEEHFDGKTIE